jgi:hypothetical protein
MSGNLLGSTVVSTSLVLGIIAIISPITGIEFFYTFLEDTTINDIIPNTSPIQSNITWEITPALTNGLSFDSSTGKIYGKTNNVSSDLSIFNKLVLYVLKLETTSTEVVTFALLI